MPKLLFFDIDGTLAYPLREPPRSATVAIREARSKGHKAFISTGRTHDSIPPAVAEIGFDGGIFSAGGIVVLGDQILTQIPLVAETEVPRLRWRNLFAMTLRKLAMGQ